MPKRELVQQGPGKRYVRRDAQGRFTSDQAEVGRSLTVDRRTKAKTTVPKGQGDRGDQQSRPGSRRQLAATAISERTDRSAISGTHPSPTTAKTAELRPRHFANNRRPAAALSSIVIELAGCITTFASRSAASSLRGLCRAVQALTRPRSASRSR
jgi:hypothetical protein